MVMKVASADVKDPKVSEKSYREALSSSEETLGVANATRFEVHGSSVDSSFHNYTQCILCTVSTDTVD